MDYNNYNKKSKDSLSNKNSIENQNKQSKDENNQKSNKNSSFKKITINSSNEELNNILDQYNEEGKKFEENSNIRFRIIANQFENNEFKPAGSMNENYLGAL